MSLHTHTSQSWHQKLPFVYQSRCRRTKCQLLFLLLSAAHMKVMSEKVITAQCTFHQVSLASVSLSSTVNKSEWQPRIICCSLWVPTSLLFYPPECLCHARLHLDTLRKYWSQSPSAQLAAREHWCYPESFWQTVTNSMHQSWLIPGQLLFCFFFFTAMGYYDKLKIQLWNEEKHSSCDKGITDVI